MPKTTRTERVEKEVTKAFERGYLTCVGNLLHGHGDSAIVTDLLNALGTKRFVGISDFDMKLIRKTDWWERYRLTRT